MIEKYLMSFDEYNKVDHPTPYSFKVETGKQYLYYFGANHSRDPQDKQYEMIRVFWREFLEKTGGKNCLVIVEGGKRKVCDSEEEAIHRGSEASFITYLAAKEGTETFSPEPPEKLKFEELAKHFGKDEIAFYHFARMAHQWNTIPESERPDFYDYLGKSLSQEQKDSGWSDFDFSIENMIQIQKAMFQREFDMHDQKFFYDVINPTTQFSKVNAVSRFEDEGFRDSCILKEIERFWSEGKNLFIVYGVSHAVMHEPAIMKLA